MRADPLTGQGGGADQLLARMLELTRSAAQRLLEAGAVTPAAAR